jgi:hypothetical protein
MTVRKASHTTGTRSCGDIKTESLGLSSSRISTFPVVFFVFYQVFVVFYQVFFTFRYGISVFKVQEHKRSFEVRDAKRTPRIECEGISVVLGNLIGDYVEDFSCPRICLLYPYDI